MSNQTLFSSPFALKGLRPGPALLLSIVTAFFIIAYTTGCSPKVWKAPTIMQTASAPGKLLLGSPAISLSIHHININNGDASVIRIVHQDGTETKVLIDGGQLSPDQALLPYCNAVFQNNQFKYVVLTHYHNDHYNGLLALGNGAIRGDYYIDLGGYSMRNTVSGVNLPGIQPRDTTCPWTDTSGIFGGTMDNYIAAIGRAADSFGLRRYGPMTTTPDQIGSLIGVVVPLDTFIVRNQKYPISLRCVALWGYTMGANGAATDDWNRGASKNDPCIGFVLECGPFRYFFGGDMGGQASGSYIDQETTLAAGFQYLYKGARSFYGQGNPIDGHVCGFKANHHGSDHSNNTTLLNTMRPGICVTSAGSNSAWHLPSIGFLNRLNAAPPVTLPSEIPNTEPWYIKSQAFLFTNLYDFGGNNNSLEVADQLFVPRAKTTYQFGNTPLNPKAGYVVSLDLTSAPFLSEYIWLGVSSVEAQNYAVSPISYIVCHRQ